MDLERINILIEKYNNILFGNPIYIEEINAVEKSLNITLPLDFKILSEKISYEFIGGLSFLNFGRDDEESVIRKTLNMYECFFKKNYLVLYQDDAGIIIMKDISYENSLIYWCSNEDLEAVLLNQTLKYAHDFFPTFTDFFEFLLDEEEKLRGIITS